MACPGDVAAYRCEFQIRGVQLTVVQFFREAAEFGDTFRWQSVVGMGQSHLFVGQSGSQ